MRRMPHVLFVTLVVLIALPISAGLSSAQPPDAPLVFLLESDLWAWHGPGSSLIQLTQDLHVTGGEVSPDGSRLSFSALSPVTVDALERVGFFSGTWPADIGVLDLLGGEIEMVAVQPDDAVLFAEGGTPDDDNVLMRSKPTWSPDGMQLAWTEAHYPSYASRLLVYDLATRATRVLVSGLPETAGVPGPIEVQWGAPGLALLVPSFNAADTTFFTAIWLYSEEGELRATLRVPEDQGRIMDGIMWVQAGERALLGVRYYQAPPLLLDPLTGEPVALDAPLELYSPSAPDGSITFTGSRDPEAEDRQRNYQWQVHPPDGAAFELDYHGATILLAPTGDAFAYVTYDSLYEDGRLELWQAGAVNAAALAIDGRAQGFWGPTGWRVSQNTAKK